MSAQVKDRQPEFPPYPCHAGGFTEFSNISIPLPMPRYQPEMAAPLPPDGSTLIQQSDALLARPVRGVSKNIVSGKKRRRRTSKQDNITANGRESTEVKLEEVPERDIRETELQREVEVEAEEAKEVRSSRRIITRSRTQVPSGSSLASMRTRSGAPLPDSADIKDKNDLDISRSSDEDFM